MGVAVSRLHENQAHGMEAVEWNRGVGPRGAGPGRARSVARCERPHWYRGDARAGRPEGSNFPDAFVDSNTLLLMHDQAYRSNLDARRAQGSAPRAVDLAPDGAATMSFYGPLQVRGRQHEARLGADLLD